MLIDKKEVVFVSKAWGWEEWVHNSPEYCGKILFVKAGKKCSWHFHRLKRETFKVFSGEILLYYGWSDNIEEAEKLILRPGDIFEVERGLRHRFEGILDSHIIEFSTEHFDSDSYRIKVD